MDVGDEDDEEELEQYLREIDMVRDQMPVGENLRGTSAPPHPNHYHPSRSSVPSDNPSLKSAFGNLSFGERTGRGSNGGYCLEENRLHDGYRGLSNTAFDCNMVFGNSLPNGPGASISSGLYSNENFFSSEFRSEPASVGMETQLYFSPTRLSRAGMMDHELVISSTAPHVAYQQQHFQSSGFRSESASLVMESQVLSSQKTMSRVGIMDHGLGTTSMAPDVTFQQLHFQPAYAGPILVTERIDHPGLFSPPITDSDQYSNTWGKINENLTVANPVLAAYGVIQPGIFSPSVGFTDYSNLGGIVTDNLAFPGPVLAAERIVQPSGLMTYNISLARALQLQADHIQGNLRDLSLRGRHQRAHQRASVHSQNPIEHQQHETRSHVSGRCLAERVVRTGSNSNHRPLARGHAPTGTCPPQAATQHHNRSERYSRFSTNPLFIKS